MTWLAKFQARALDFSQVIPMTLHIISYFQPWNGNTNIKPGLGFITLPKHCVSTTPLSNFI